MSSQALEHYAPTTAPTQHANAETHEQSEHTALHMYILQREDVAFLISVAWKAVLEAFKRHFLIQAALGILYIH